VRSNIEVFLYQGLWAVFFHRVAGALFRAGMVFLSRAVSQFSRWLTGIEIHPGARLGSNVFIDHGSGVVIGETCEIGNNVTIYQGVTLGGTGKDRGKRHPTIGSNVIIGSGAKLLGPIVVGEDSKIGAGTVVLKDVPPGSTIVGEAGRDTKFEASMRLEIENLKKKIGELEEMLGVSGEGRA